MRGPVMRRHVAVLGLDQDGTVLIDQHGAERMVAVGKRAAGDVERSAQEILIKFDGAEMRNIAHQCPAMCRPISVRSASLARAS